MKIVAIVALALLEALVAGQEPWSKQTIMMLLRPDVQSKMHLTKQQAQKIEAAFGDRLGRTPDGKPLLLRGWPTKDALKVEAVLTEEQKQRFSAVAIQEKGGMMLLEARVQALMKLTKDQLAKLEELRTDFQAQTNTAALEAAGRNGRLSITKNTLDAYRASLLKVLTKAQRSRFDELGERGFKPEGIVTQPVNRTPASDGLLPPGTQIPDFALKDPKGRMHSSKEYRGKVVVLEFWATWCVPCRKLMPVLQELHNRYGEKSVAVVGVSLDTKSDAGAFMKERGHSYPVLVGGMSMAGKYRVQGLPTLYIVDPNGRIVHGQVGVTSKDGVRIAEIVSRLVRSRVHAKQVQ